jgi:hypothetical protein
MINVGRMTLRPTLWHVRIGMHACGSNGFLSGAQTTLRMGHKGKKGWEGGFFQKCSLLSRQVRNENYEVFCSSRRFDRKQEAE